MKLDPLYLRGKKEWIENCVISQSDLTLLFEKDDIQ